MSTAARLSVSDPVSDVDTIEALKRDLKSAQQRNTILLRALNGAPLMTEPVATIRPEGLVHVARTLERSGCVPSVRFARGDDAQITGVELVFVKPEKSSSTHDVEPPRHAGMEVM